MDEVQTLTNLASHVYNKINTLYVTCSSYIIQRDLSLAKMIEIFDTVLIDPFNREVYLKELETYKIYKTKYEETMEKLLREKEKLEKITESLKTL